MPLTKRPFEYTEEFADAICSGIASGRPLVKICEPETMPSTVSVYKWLRTNPEFAVNYARARVDQADTFADQIVAIADDTEMGVKTTTKSGGTTKDGQPADDETVETQADMIEHRRLRVEARKWVAARMNPKKYSERFLNEHSGPDGGPIETNVQHRVEYVIVNSKTSKADHGSVPSDDQGSEV